MRVFYLILRNVKPIERVPCHQARDSGIATLQLLRFHASRRRTIKGSFTALYYRYCNRYRTIWFRQMDQEVVHFADQR